MYGLVATSPDLAFVTRMTSSLTEVYSYSYPFIPTDNAFAVDSQEGYYYIIDSTGSGYKIVEVSAADGSVSAVKTSAGLLGKGSYSRISPLPGTAGIFITTFKTGDNNLY
jgi:hypothetical protein